MKHETNKLAGWFDRIITGLLFSLVILVPVVFSTAFYTTFSAPKLVILQIITAVILLVYGAKIFITEEFPVRRTKGYWIMLLYAFITVMNVLFSVACFSSLYGTYGRFIGVITMVNFFILVFIAANFLGRKKIAGFILAGQIVAGIISVFGIFQYLGFWQEIFHWSSNPSERIFSTIGHPNHLAIYLVMNIVMGLAVMPAIKRNYIKIITVISVILQFGALVLTGSRGALLAIVITLPLLAGSLHIRHYKKIIGIIITIVMILIGALFFFWNDLSKLPLINRTEQTINIIREGNIPDRISWWLSALKMIEDRPFFGYGVSTFRDVYVLYRRTDYQTQERNGMEYRITPETAHNEYLNTAATQGIIGLAAFLALVFFTLYKLSRQERTAEIRAVFFAIIAFLVDAVFNFGVITTYSLFFILIGIGLGLASEDKVRIIPMHGYRKFSVIIPVFLALFLVLDAVKFTISEVNYRQAVEASFTNDYKSAVKHFESAVNAHPSDFSLLQAYADFAVNAAKNSEQKAAFLNIAIDNYEKALQINKYHPSTFFNAGIAYMQLYILLQNDYALSVAEEYLQKSTSLAVNNPLYPYYAARAFQSLAFMPSISVQEGKHMAFLEKALEFIQMALLIEPGYLDSPALEKQIQLQIEQS